MNNYLEYLKDEQIIETPNEKVEGAIKRAEGIFDRLDEIVQIRKVVMNNGQETIEVINDYKSKMKNVIKSFENDGIVMDKANDELIDKIIELEETKRIRRINLLQKQINEINYKYNMKTQELKNDLKNPEEYNGKKKERRMNTIIDLNKITQFEECMK